jgi:hypothetical protein
MFILILFLAIFSGEVFAQGETEVPSGFSVPPGRPVPVSILSHERAYRLFHELSRAPNIPFQYPVNGCHARATAMAEIAGQQGIELIRIYAEGFLQAEAPPPFRLLQWDMHVASAAMVINNGQIELMVFDPSLFDRPVTEQEWLARLSFVSLEIPYPTQIQHVYYGGRHQYLARSNEIFRDSPVSESLADAEETNRREFRLQRLPEQRYFPVNRMPVVQGAQ